MTQNPEITFFSPGNTPDNDRWERVNELIGSILSDEDTQIMIAPLNTTGLPHSNEADFQLFVGEVLRNRPRREIHPLSLVECWVEEQKHLLWFSSIQERIHSLKVNFTTYTPEQFFAPLLEAIAAVSQISQPAPAYRAIAPAKMIFTPRRRDLEPADLPVFNPLFCTAIPTKDKPILIHGLSPKTSYTLLLRCAAKPEWKPEITVNSSVNGSLSFDFSQILKHVLPTQSEAAWFLMEQSESHSGGWTSGLIWLESKDQQSDSFEIEDFSTTPAYPDETIQDEMNKEDIQTLFEINQAIVQGYYLQAYEKARQTLLFQSRKADQERYIPLRECLWHMIHQIFEKMLNKVEQSKDLFRQIKKEWDAITPLDKLRDQIRGRD